MSRPCLPGASLDGGEKDGVVTGKMRVKVGPISAEFNGVAQITRDEAARRGAIVGSGRDTRSNSATRGIVAYSVKPDEGGAGSRVDVEVGYTLTGMLAQFGRSGLVQDIGEPSDGRLRPQSRGAPFRRRRTATARSRLLWSANLTLVR